MYPNFIGSINKEGSSRMINVIGTTNGMSISQFTDTVKAEIPSQNRNLPVHLHCLMINKLDNPTNMYKTSTINVSYAI